MQKRNWIFSRNVMIVLICRIFIVLLLFSLSRIGFYLFNFKMFPGITPGEFFSILKGGLLFDISAALYINMLFILLQIVPFDFRYNKIYQRISMWLFFIFNGLALAINSSDYIYYRFVFKRATADVFGTFEKESHLSKMFFKYMLDYWPVAIICFSLWALMVFLYKKVKVKKPEPSNRVIYYIINILFIPIVLALVIGGARGGYKHSTRPITISNAARFVKTPRDVAIVLNTPFSLFRTYGKKTLVRYDFFEKEKLDSLFNPHYKPSGNEPFVKDNVVIIILESFAREYIGAMSGYLENGTFKGYTPFVDSLINVSLTFDVSLGNGKKSIDAMPSILASLPSLETPYIISHYANNEVNGLAGLLKKKGYYTSFFHGAPNGSMGFDSFARMTGFDDYFGLNEYPDKNDFDGIWGVWDEPFFHFYAQKLNSFPQPFMASIFSISSHHPFKVPDKYKDKFPKGPAPIVEVVGYTDFALREFFDEISSSPWFRNTLFVITADHTNESIHKEFQNDFGSYCIPVIFYKPGSDLKGRKNRIAQQIDIMPTILSYLNFDEEYIAFGNNLLDDSNESFAFNTNSSTYHLYMNDHLMEMIDNKPVSLYNYKTDKYLESNILSKEPDLAGKMEQKLQAIIQSYNGRLLDNDMIVRKQEQN
ncbi:MAG: sulfatase-like hydrolase/transferase [Bacteroidia bacterium]|nr:sulfatase-like hydrolase/transferase [Bacteroidia bacterium]